MKFIIFILLITMHFTIFASEIIVCSFEDWRPWLITKGKNDGEGILIDLLKHATEKTDYKLEIVILPFNRRNYFEWGKTVNAEPGCIPEWREKFSDTSIYTIPLISTNNVIIAKKGHFKKQNNELEDFYGKRIGTNLGYFYSDGFSEAFDYKLIFRDDSKEGSSILKKLNTYRVDCIIIDKYEAEYWIKYLDFDKNDFQTVYTFSTTSDLRVRLHKDIEHILDTLNKGIKQVIDSEDFQIILDKYLN